MNLSLFIANRYLISKKSRNVINIITFIALIGVAGVTAAMIIVLSTMNGFDQLIGEQSNSFEPDLTISSVKSKSIQLNSFPFEKIQHIKEISSIQKIIEEDALFRHKDNQILGRIKGTQSEYASLMGLDSLMIDGEFNLFEGKYTSTSIGAGLAYLLNFRLGQELKPIAIYIPKRKTKTISSLDNAFNYRHLYPNGIFSSDDPSWEKTAFIPYKVAEDLLSYEGLCTNIEINLSNPDNLDAIQSQIISILGNDYEVLNKRQLHKFEYRIQKIEKFAAFLILTFILLIALFNMTGALVMLILEKKEDIIILKSLGTTNRKIQNIFFMEGILITSVGIIAGLTLGSLLIWLQEEFELITLGGDAFYVVSAYPVDYRWSDLPLIIITVFTAGVLASWFPVKNLSSKILKK